MLHRPGGLQAQVCCKEKLLVQRSIPQGMPASAPDHHCKFWKQHSALLEGCCTVPVMQVASRSVAQNHQGDAIHNLQ